MLRLSSSLIQEIWDNKLRMESMTRDVFSDFEGTFKDNKKTLPSGIVMNAKLPPSARTLTVGLLRNLDGAGVTGRTDQIGEEIDQVTKEVLLFSNDVSQAVNTERYGIDAHDKAAYRIIEAVQPQLSRWHQEIKGRYIREALLERYSINLTVAPISRTKRFNENILVTGVTLANQPVYDSTASDYEENIGDAMTTMSTNAFDVALLNAAQEFTVATKTLEPRANGRYIFLVPSNQAVLLKDPAATTSISGLFKDSHVIEAATNAYRQYLGSWGIFDLFEDTRAPLIARTGSDGSFVITAFYKGAGADDDRTPLPAGTLADVGFILSDGAVSIAQHDALHFEEEIQNYKKVIGVGAFAGYGANRLVFDDEGSETDTSEINQNSIAVLASHNAITA